MWQCDCISSTPGVTAAVLSHIVYTQPFGTGRSTHPSPLPPLLPRPQQLTRGFSQGSPLSPVLYNVFTKRLANQCSSHLAGAHRREDVELIYKAATAPCSTLHFPQGQGEARGGNQSSRLQRLSCTRQQSERKPDRQLPLAMEKPCRARTSDSSGYSLKEGPRRSLRQDPATGPVCTTR